MASFSSSSFSQVSSSNSNKHRRQQPPHETNQPPIRSSMSVSSSSCSSRSSVSMLFREPVPGSVEYLERCRKARQEEQETARQEEIRLQEVLSFCEEYNKECEKFFILEKALNHSAPKSPAKYLFTRKDNITVSSANHPHLSDPGFPHQDPSKLIEATNSIYSLPISRKATTTTSTSTRRTRENADCGRSLSRQQLEHNSAVSLQNSLMSRIDAMSHNNGNNIDEDVDEESRRNSGSDREQSVSPASTITEESINRKPEEQESQTGKREEEEAEQQQRRQLQNHKLSNNSSQNNFSVRRLASPNNSRIIFDDGSNDDEEDEEELREFQALEHEVNLTENIAKFSDESVDQQQLRGPNSNMNQGSNGIWNENANKKSQHHVSSSATNNWQQLQVITDQQQQQQLPQSLIVSVPLAQAEANNVSAGTPDGSEGTIFTATTSSQESDDKMTTSTADAEGDFSSLIMSIHSSMKMKGGKASSLPPNQIYSVNSCNGTNSSSIQSHAFDRMSHRNGRDPKRAASAHPNMSRSMNGHGHGTNGLIGEMKILGHNVSAFTSDDLQISCCTCSGYLWKLCTDKKRWKKRFFHFDRYHRVFFYYKTAEQFRKVKKPNGGVGFIELKDVYVDRERSRVGSALRTGSDPNISQKSGNSSNGNSDVSNSRIGMQSSWYSSIRIKKKSNSHRNPKYSTLLHQNNGNSSNKDHHIQRNNNSNNNNNNNNINDSTRNGNTSPRKSSIASGSSHISSPCNKYVFCVETSNRHFILSSQSYELMRVWVDVIFTGVESYFG